MKLVAWAIAVLGIWILLGGIIGGLNRVSIICGNHPVPIFSRREKV